MKSCQYCHQIFFDEDRENIVVCPECGAPYHRECYEKVGRCVYESKHGTDEQYDALIKNAEEKEQENEENKSSEDNLNKEVCMNCGRKSSAEHIYCPYCGAPKNKPDENYTRFGGGKFYEEVGGEPKHTELVEGVTVHEAACFVAVGHERYIRKFKENKRASWNWAAFLIPQAWFGFRKMYKAMYVSLAAFLITLICMVPFYSEIYAVLDDYPEAKSSSEAFKYSMEATEEALQKADSVKIALFFVSGIIDMATRISAGIFGDRIYRKRTITTVKKLKNEESDVPLEKRLILKGGINPFIGLLMLFVLNSSDVIISLILSFI